MKNKLLAFLIAALVTLNGCGFTNHILSRKKVKFEKAPTEEVARKFYVTAKDCWTKEENNIYAAIIVENSVSLDSISVAARFDSFGSGVLNPFLKFIFTENGTNTNIELMTQEIKWKGYEKHLRDANNWLSGNFTCGSK